MWKYLTQKAIRSRYAKSLKRPERRFVPYREATTVVALADGAGAPQAAPLLQAMSREGKKVVLCVFTSSASKTGIAWPDIEVVEISSEELAHGHTVPRPEVCRDFVALQPDVLLDLTLTESLPVAFLSVISTAPMRMGLQKNALAPADIMLQIDPEKATVEELLQNMLFYWKNIAAKNNNS